MVVLQRRPGRRHVVIKMFQFFNPGQNVIFDGFGQGDVVSRKNELHA